MDVIFKFARGSGDLMNLAGCWGDVGDEFVEEFLKAVREAWEG